MVVVEYFACKIYVRRSRRGKFGVEIFQVIKLIKLGSLGQVQALTYDVIW